MTMQYSLLIEIHVLEICCIPQGLIAPNLVNWLLAFQTQSCFPLSFSIISPYFSDNAIFPSRRNTRIIDLLHSMRTDCTKCGKDWSRIYFFNTRLNWPLHCCTQRLFRWKIIRKCLVDFRNHFWFWSCLLLNRYDIGAISATCPYRMQ